MYNFPNFKHCDYYGYINNIFIVHDCAEYIMYTYIVYLHILKEYILNATFNVDLKVQT